MARIDNRLAASITLTVVSSCAAVVLAELFLGVGGFSWPVLYGPDPTTGTFHRPNISFTYTDEGEGEVHINSAGLRDREHSLTKPARTYRIAVLGDSYTQALQVNQEQTFWAVLEKQLNVCRPFGAKNEVELINFGVSGFGTAQELLTLRTRAWEYQPDLVLLAFTTGNDVRNNSRALESRRTRPFFTLDADNKLTEDMRFLSDPGYIRSNSRSATLLRKFSDYSRLLQLVRRVKNQLKYRIADRPAVTGSVNNELGLDDAVYLNNPGTDWDDAWAVTQALLMQMNAEVMSHGARFLVVTLSNGIQVHPDYLVTEEFTNSLGISDIFYPDKRIQKTGNIGQFEVLMLAPELQQIAQHTQTYMHGFAGSLGKGHLNASGHQYAAGLISGYLCGWASPATQSTP